MPDQSPAKATPGEKTGQTQMNKDTLMQMLKNKAA
jgi:hypothetical protein